MTLHKCLSHQRLGRACRSGPTLQGLSQTYSVRPRRHQKPARMGSPRPGSLLKHMPFPTKTTLPEFQNPLGKNSHPDLGLLQSKSMFAGPSLGFYLGAELYGFAGGSLVKNLLTNAGDAGSVPGSERVPWRRDGQPTPVFLPGKSHGQRSLAGYSPWGHRESDRTE